MAMLLFELDDIPDADNYNKHSCGITHAKIQISLDNAGNISVSMYQQDGQGGTAADEFYSRDGIYFVFDPSGTNETPDAEELEQMVKENKDLFVSLMESWDIDWDGQNHVGSFDDSIYSEIKQLINALPPTKWQTYYAGEYFVDGYVWCEKVIERYEGSLVDAVNSLAEEEESALKKNFVFLCDNTSDFIAGCFVRSEEFSDFLEDRDLVEFDSSNLALTPMDRLEAIDEEVANNVGY